MIEISGTTITYSRGDDLNLTFSATNNEDLIGSNDVATFSIKDFSGSTILSWEQKGNNSTILQVHIPSESIWMVPSGTHYWDLMVDFKISDKRTERVTMNYMGKFICKDVAHVVPIPEED